MAIINRQMYKSLEHASENSASTISQKWEMDARKDPEEEYFRLVSKKLQDIPTFAVAIFFESLTDSFLFIL